MLAWEIIYTSCHPAGIDIEHSTKEYFINKKDARKIADERNDDQNLYYGFYSVKEIEIKE